MRGGRRSDGVRRRDGIDMRGDGETRGTTMTAGNESATITAIEMVEAAAEPNVCLSTRYSSVYLFVVPSFTGMKMAV